MIYAEEYMRMKNYQSITITNDEPDDEFDNNNNNHCNNNNTNNINTNNNNEHPQDHLAPSFDSTERPSNLFVGTFNLIATIVGGAVLSLPIAFSKCGVVFTTLAMLLSAYMTYMSLIMTCYCSRRGGGSSYGEVVRSAFGERMEESVSWLLFLFLLFVIAAYMVLIRDIWTPLVQEVFLVDMNGDYVLLTIVGLLLPFLFQRSLHALRYNCYVSSISIFILGIALCRGGLQKRMNSNSQEEEEDDNITSSNSSLDDAIQFFKIPSVHDVLFSFPLVTLAFLCHFNIIAIQNALKQPTRERTQNLIRYAIGASFALMYTFGLGGYLYAGSNTQGNILLNVPMGKQVGEDNGEYYLFLLGRIGCGTTIVFAMPLMALPCREALLEIVDVWFHHSHHQVNSNDNTTATPLTIDDDKSCWKVFHRFNRAETDRDAIITTEDEVTEILPEEDIGLGLVESPSRRRSTVLIRHDPIQSDYIFRNTLAHYGSTLLITTTCYLGAVAVSGVATVWSFIGSSMAFFIAFILPCGCFLVIESAVPTIAEGGDRHEKWIKVAWAILVFSVLGAIICTVNNTVGFG